MNKEIPLRLLDISPLILLLCCAIGCDGGFNNFPPLVDTPTVADLTTTTVTLGGTVTGDGGSAITERGVIYARNVDNPGLAGGNVLTATTGGSTGVFTLGVTGLDPGTAYGFKAYAKNVNGTSYSELGTFTTLAPEPAPVVGAVVQTVAMQPDGMHIIGGLFSMVSGAPHAGLARIQADGNVDASFTTSVGGGPIGGGVVYWVSVQHDEKILIGGDFVSVNGTPRNNIARLHPNGSLDTTFDPGTGTDNPVYTLGIQSDGKIVIGGNFTSVNTTGRNRIARLTSTGALDTTFDPGTGLNGAVYGLVVQPDGQTVIVGAFTTVNSITRNRIARLNPDGSEESTTTFNPGTGANQNLACVALQPNKKILIGGFFTDINGTPRNYIARLHEDGPNDNSFNPGTGASHPVESVAVQTNGGILIGGYFSSVNGTLRNKVARLNGNGSPDLTIDPGLGLDVWPFAIALRTDGKILLGGQDAGGLPGTTLTAQEDNNTAATQDLIAPDSTQVQWLRGGTGPEVSPVTFELSTDSGTTWTALGDGTRITGGWELTGLTLPASGSLRARGRASHGSGSGLVEQIATFPSPPVIIEPTSAGLSGTGAVLGGNITNGSGSAITEQGVVYSRTTDNANPQIGGAGVTTVTSSIAGTGVFTTNVAGLSPATHYTYKAYATNAGGTSFTGAASFETHSAATVLTTGSSAINDNNAMLAGEVTSDGGSAITDRGVVYVPTSGTDPLGTKDTWTSLSASGTTGSFNVNATGLDPGTQHAFAAYAVNGVGTSYGETQFFTTTGGPPSEPENSPSGGTYTGTGTGPLELGGLPAGTFDDTFDADLSTDGTVQAIAVLPDGKILIAGEFTTVGGANHLRLARLGANGVVDATFTTEVNGPVYSIAVQGDGKILLGGLFNLVNGATRNGLVRLNPDGSVESSATFNPGAGADNLIYSVAIQPDGRIVIGGLFTSVQGTASNRIARLGADGALDPDFDPGTGANDAVYSVEVLPDGKILLGGHFTSIDGTGRNRIARLNDDGSHDTTFNTGSGADARVTGVAQQSDGKILVGGSFTSYNGTPRNRILRLFSNGSIDTDFNPGTGADDHVFSLAVQTDGKVLIGGRFQTVNGTSRGRIARLLATGAVDTDFNPGTGADAEVDAVALQEDGSILIGGLFRSYNSNSSQGLARIANDPATQSLLAVNGTQVTWLRSGAGPEVLPAKFELSTDGGTTWTELGTPGRIAGGWSLAGQILPRAGTIRSQGKTAGAFLGGSSGVVEDTVAYDHNGIVAGLRGQLAVSKKKETTLKKQIKAAKKKRKVALVKSLNKKLKAASRQTRTISTNLGRYP